MAKRACKARLVIWLPGLILLLAACGGDSTPTSIPSPTLPAPTSTGPVGTPTPINANAATATDTPVVTAIATTTAPATVAATPVPAIQGVGSQVVPDFPGLKPAQPGQPLAQRLEGQLAGNSTNTRFFTTNASFEEIVAYYDKELTAAGYTKQGRQTLTAIGNLKITSGTIVGYGQNGTNSKRVALIDAGLVTDNFIAQLSTAELTNLNLNRGDHLIIILENVPVGLG